MTNTNQALGLQVDPEEDRASTPTPATIPHAPVTKLPIPATIPKPSTGFKSPPMATTFPKLKYSTHTPTKLRYVQSTDTLSEATNASPPTSPSRTTLDQVTASETATMKRTLASSELTMTRSMDSTMPHEAPDDGRETPEQSAMSPGERQISPERTKLDNLRKRRASKSPEKFNTGRFEPLALKTAPSPPDFEPPAKRGRTESKLQIIYDVYGKPTLRQIPVKKTDAFMQKMTSPPSPASGAMGLGLTLPNTSAPPQPPAQPLAASQNAPFNLIDAIAMDAGLAVIFTSYLTMPSLISLYAISKRFHYEFNLRATAFVLASMRTWAPNADKLFPWRCYLDLCIKDPIHRQIAVPADFDPTLLGDFSRDVPSLRWLQMVVWRHGVVQDMILTLASKALRVPKGSADAIQRMWFIMDLPYNAHRLATMRSTNYVSDETILNATHFFMKVDMAFTDPMVEPVRAPVAGGAPVPAHWIGGSMVGCKLREVLLAERSLTPLWRVIKGWTWDIDDPARPMRKIDVLKLYMRHSFRLPNILAPNLRDLRQYPVMRLHYDDIMKVGRERVYRADDDELLKYSRQPEPLIRPDQMVIGESVRRELNLGDHLIEMVISGFVTDSGQKRPVFTYDELCRMNKRPWEMEVVVREKRERMIHLAQKHKNFLETQQKLREHARSKASQVAQTKTGNNGPVQASQVAAVPVSGPGPATQASTNAVLSNQAQLAQGTAQLQATSTVGTAATSQTPQPASTTANQAASGMQNNAPSTVPSTAAFTAAANAAMQSAQSTTVPTTNHNSGSTSMATSSQSTGASSGPSNQSSQATMPSAVVVNPTMNNPSAPQPNLRPSNVPGDDSDTAADTAPDKPQAGTASGLPADSNGKNTGKGKQRATEEEVQAQQMGKRVNSDEDGDAMEVEYTGKGKGRMPE